MMNRMDAFKNYQNSSFIGRAINSKVFLEPLIRYGIMWAENPEQWTSHKKLQRVQSRINKYINFSIGEDDKYKPIKEGGGRVLCLRNLVLSAYSNFFLKIPHRDKSQVQVNQNWDICSISLLNLTILWYVHRHFCLGVLAPPSPLLGIPMSF